MLARTQLLRHLRARKKSAAYSGKVDRRERLVTALRHGFLTWLDLTGSDNAQVEIAVTGRTADVSGMSDLIGRVADSMTLGAGPADPA